MAVLRSFCVLLLFQAMGEGVRWVAQVPVPGPVLGMVLLTGFLLVRRRGVSAELGQTADGLLGWMGLLFVPAGVGIVTQLGVLRAAWLPIGVGLVGSTVLTLGVTGWVMARLGARGVAETDEVRGLSAGVGVLLAVTLTLVAYLGGVWVQGRVRSAVANPVLLAIVAIGVVLRLARVPYADYFAGAQLIHFLLGPATVALAVPLVRSLEHIRRGLWPMLAALTAGSLVGMVSGYGLVRVLGGSRELAATMAPKSVTTPIAMGVAQGLGGVPSLTAVLAIAGAFLVAVGMDWVLGPLGVRQAAARGLAAGTAGSGIGTTRVIPEGAVTAAFAGVAMGLNGVLTAVLAPGVVGVLRRW